MNKSHQDTAVSVMAYHNSDCDELIASVQLEMTNTAKERAELLAEANQPRLEDDLNNYTSSITAGFNTLKSKVLTLLNIDGLKSKGASIVNRFQKKEEELTDERTQLESKIRDQKKEVKKVESEDILDRMKKWKSVNLIIILLLGVEAIAMEQAMASISSQGFIARLVIALSVSISTYFIAKMQVTQARKAHGRFKRALIHLGMTTLAISTFYAISMLRVGYLEEMNPQLADRAHPIFFTAISALVYLATVFATSMYLVSRQEQKKAKDYLTKKNELKELEQKFEKVDQELKALPELKENQLYEVFSLIKMAETYLERIEHIYTHVIGDFILTNNIKRHDGKSIGTAQYKDGVIPPLVQYQFNTEQL